MTDKQYSRALDICTIVAWLVVVVVFLWASVTATSQHHPPEHQGLHDKFYAGWYRPDKRNGGWRVQSCCNRQDCAPAEIKAEGGRYYFRNEFSLWRWVHVPAELFEHNQPDPRESPDGQNHVCFNGSNVLCAVLGSGG